MKAPEGPIAATAGGWGATAGVGVFLAVDGGGGGGGAVSVLRAGLAGFWGGVEGMMVGQFSLLSEEDTVNNHERMNDRNCIFCR
jgi:hypothetical protein